MVANKVQQVPEIDSDGRVIYLHTWDEFISKESISSKMVIMAGVKAPVTPSYRRLPKANALGRWQADVTEYYRESLR